MTEQPPQEPKKKSKGLPTWVWFVGTFAVVSVAGNAVFGGNTWINSSINFVNNTIASMQVEEDTSQNDFCLTGEVSEIDKANTLTVVTEADALVGTTTGAIGFASLAENADEMANAIQTVRDSGPEYLRIGERLLTAKECGDPTYEYLMEDFGNAMVDMGENFGQWDPETLTTDPALLLTVTPLIETAASKARAILTYVENLK
ncbi:MAG: hypothetical protein RLZZ610_549 [Actinomycetota bacterium]|jgi:hypothetical protein